MELLFIANKTEHYKVISDTANISSIKWLYSYTGHIFNQCIKYTKQYNFTLHYITLGAVCTNTCSYVISCRYVS